MEKNQDWQYAEAIHPIAYPKPPRSYLWLQMLAAFGFLACLYFMVGSLDYADELTAEAQAKLDRAQAIKAAGESAALLTHPIPYAATVKDCLPDGTECSRERYYFTTSTTGGK